MRHPGNRAVILAATLSMLAAACGTGSSDPGNTGEPDDETAGTATINSALLYDNLVHTSRHPAPACTGAPPTCTASIRGRTVHITPDNSTILQPLPLVGPVAATVLHEDYPRRAAFAFANFPDGYAVPAPGLSAQATWSGRMTALTHNFHQVDGNALITVPDLSNPAADIVLTPAIPTYTPIRWLAVRVLQGRFFHSRRGFNSYVQGGLYGAEAAGIFEHSYSTSRSLIGSFAGLLTGPAEFPPEVTQPVAFSPRETPTPQPWTRPADSISITNLVRRDAETTELINRDRNFSCTSSHSLCEARLGGPDEAPGQTPIGISQYPGASYAATDFRSMGSWNSASFGAVAVATSMDAEHQFAGAYAYALGRRYPDALASITDIGTISWNGEMIALAPDGSQLDGTATIRIENFGTGFDEGRHQADVLLTPAENEYAPMGWNAIPVIQGRFLAETADDDYVKGAFYGPTAETAAGVFERNTLVGAFGAARQEH